MICSRYLPGVDSYFPIMDNDCGWDPFATSITSISGSSLLIFILVAFALGQVIQELGDVSIKKIKGVFDLPVQLALITSSGQSVEKSVRLTQRSQTVDLGVSEAVTKVRIDPHHELLLQRRMGERVKFELRAPAAKAVSLAGSFALKPIPANRDGDAWRRTAIE